MNDKSSIIYLNDNISVSLPNNTGDIYLEFEDASGFYLSKEDVLKLLERFN